MRNLPQAASRLTSISRRKLYLAILAATQFTAVGQAWAGPEGGQVVGGTGSIKQSGTETVINQQTDRMAIDWQSFDVKVDERVQFIQPNSSSVALNRVLSNKGSEILGRVDANGHVFLVNPNGVVFGKDSHINVGGILASGMSIDPTEFMNGNFTLNSIDGTEGKVINSGIINAATGGSVTLLGKEVKNEGLIVANLGAVNLAAGKEAVVTFDSSGLVGVKVTKAILQNELGVDAAVLNTGEINAQGGRILITASTSQDIFSQAVNHGELNAASSAVINADGSFTLGGGADVVNTGTLNASSTNGDAGQIVAVGNNVTNSGNISANTQNGKAGHIELNSADTTQLTQNSAVSAQATLSGKGGDVKVLGNKVGAFDTASINASGANGGGQILFGGDQTGKNKLVNNANFIYLGENTNAKTDALLKGNGGKLITFAQDTARVYGNLSARGGSESGNGGFIETSGLKGFDILRAPDISAPKGLGGTWLIDPDDITISNTAHNNDAYNNGTYTSSNGNSATINWTLLEGRFSNGTTVKVQTSSGDITIGSGTYKYDFTGTSTLQLDSAKNINVNGKISQDGSGILDFILNANGDNYLATDTGKGDIVFAAAQNIDTKGGSFTASGKDFKLTDSSSSTDSISTDGGNIFLKMTGAVTLGDKNTIATGGGDFTVGEFNANPLLIKRAASFLSTDGKIDTTSATKGGSINIYTTGDASLGSMSFGGTDANKSADIGDVTVDSNSGNISLTGNYYYYSKLATNPVATMKLIASDNLGKITLSKARIDNASGNTSKLNLDFQAGNNISINYGDNGINGDSAGGNANSGNGSDNNSEIWLKGGSANLKSTAGSILISNSSTAVALGSEGGNVTLVTPGAVIIKGKGVSTGGGNFSVGQLAVPADLIPEIKVASFTSYALDNLNAKIDTSSTAKGGSINIYASGNVNLGSMSFGGPVDIDDNATSNATVGNVTVNSGGDISLTGKYDYATTKTNAEASLILDAFGKIDLQKAEIDNGGGNANATKLNLDFTATNDITINYVKDTASGIWLSGGNADLKSTSGKILISNSNPSWAALESEGGNITLDTGGAVVIEGKGINTSGGNFTVTKSASFSNTGSNLNVVNGMTDITSNTSITLGKVTTKDLLLRKGSANPIVTQSATAGENITVTGGTTFNVGTGAVTLNNIGNTFTGNILFTSAGDVNLFNSAATILGESVISGKLELTSGGSITQSNVATDKLFVGTTTNLTLTSASANDITLNNSANDFVGKVSFFGSNFGTLKLNDTNNLVLGDYAASLTSKTITLNADENLTTDKLTTHGGAIKLTAGNDTAKGGDISLTAALATTAPTDALDAGTIDLTAKAGATNLGAITTSSALAANGGSVTGSASGKKGGAITLLAASDVSVDAISAKGSSSGTTGGSGGVGGAISITSNSGNISLANAITTTGGAKGNSGNDANGGKITLKGNTLVDTALPSNTVILDARSDGTAGARGDIEFNSGTLKSTTHDNLTLFGKLITFNGDVGDSTTNRLGTLKIDSSANLGTNTQNFYAKSFDATVTNFTAALIDVSGVPSGEVKVGGANANTISINQINTSANIATNDAGGKVTIDGNKITLGTGVSSNVAINSSGAGTGLAGDIKVTASGVSPTITLKGDVKAVGEVGSKAAEFLLGGTDATEGKIDFSGYAQALTSNIKLTGRDTATNVTDTFIGQNIENTWDFATTTKTTIKNTNKILDPIAPTIEFTKFETLTGGANIDIFNINVTDSSVINGGLGNDKFNISADTTGAIFGGDGDDEFYIKAAGISAANLYGGKNTTEIGNNDIIFGFDDSINTNTWNISGSGKGKLTNSANSLKEINFAGMGIVKGGTGVDNFIIGATGISQTVYGGGGSSIDTLKAYDDTVNDTNWILTDANSGTLASGTNTNKVTFHQIGLLSGSSGKDLFGFSNLFSGTAFDGSLNGNAGVDTFTLSKDVSGGVKGGDGNDTFNISASISKDVEGGAGADTFNINATGLALNILGGTSTTSTVADIDTIAGSSASNIWNFISANKGALVSGSATVTFDEIESLKGGSSGSDTLNSATSGNNIWNLLTNNSGSLNGLDFSAMQNLAGNDNNDTVIFASTYGAAPNPVLDAKGGSNTLDVSNLDNKVVSITFTAGDFDNVSGVKGVTNVKGKLNGVSDNKGSTLSVGSVVDASWTIGDITGTTEDDGKNDGTLTIAGKTISFIDFATLAGSTGKDDFTIASGSSFNGAFNGGGGSGANTFTNSSTIGNWALTGANRGDFVVSSTLKTSFNAIQTVIGGGADTLTGQNLDSTWNITGSNSGTLGSLTFYGMNNLTGGTGVDTFIVGSSGFIGGIVKGGAGSIPTSESDEIKIEATNTKNHKWGISASNSGSLTDDSATSNYGITTFAEIEKLTGGQGDDTFKFSGSGSIVSADGGASLTKDTLDFSDITGPVSVTLGAAAINGVSGIESFIGNNTDSTLKSSSSEATTWTIEGVNDGSVKIGANAAISFMNFNNLVGGTGKDTFDFFTHPGVSLTGKISGGGGADDEIIAPDVASKWIVSDNASIPNHIENSVGTTLTNFESVEILTGSVANVDTFVFSGASTGTFNVAGKDSTGVIDILDLSGITTPITLQLGAAGIGGLTVSGIEKVILGVATNNTLIGYSEGSSWDIDRLNGGTITSLSTTTPASMQFEGFKNLTGADKKSDIFTFITGGSITGTIDGGVTDSLTENKIVGLNVNSEWSFTANNIGKILSAGVEYLHDFKNIQVLEGGNKDDSFTIAAGKGYVGTVKGGTGNANDSLVALDGANTFVINSTDSGSLNANLLFENIEKLVGGSGIDTFKFNIDTAFGGTVDAGAGSAVDVVDFSLLTTSVNVQLGTNSIQGVTNAEKVIGNLVPGTQLIAANSTGGNTWIVTSPNTGTFQNASNSSIQFSNFLSLIGAVGLNDSFTLQGTGTVASIDGGAGLGINSLAKTDGVNTWMLTDNVNTGTLNTNIHFSNIQSLVGGSETDTLIGHSKNNTWTITGKNTGSLKETDPASTASVAFINMKNLTGSAAADAFIFSTAAAQVTGLIDGGSSADLSGVTDTLDLTILASVSIQLGGDVSNSNANLIVKNIEIITAPSAHPELNNLFGGSDLAYSWLIDGTNSGSVSPTQAPGSTAAPELITHFSNFGNVIGGTNADRFSIQTGASIASIDGGSGNGDLVDYSKKADDIVIDLGGSGSLGITGITGIEGIIGNNNGVNNTTHNSTIKITNGTNTWALGSFDSVTDGINDGQLTINNSTKIISFENFNKLVGGSDVDTFNVKVDGQFRGTIDGGSTNNIFNASAATKAQTISLNGLSLGATNLIGFSNVSGSTKAASELISLAPSNTWLLDGAATNVNGTKFSNFSTLTGSTGVDTFTIKNITGLKVLLNGADANGVIDSVDLTSLAQDSDVSIGVGVSASTDLKVIGIEKIDANSNNNNTLIADKSALVNDWSITGINKGILSSTVSFTGFANLVGGAGIDNFVFTKDGMISGVIDGGTSADSNSVIDKVDISALTNPVTVEIGNTDTNNLNLINIEDIKANSAKANKLIRNDNTAYTWIINGANSGTVAPTTIAPTLPLKETITSFSGFVQLQGGLNADNFEIADAWIGSVDGSDGDDFVDYSKRTIAFTTTVGGAGNNSVKNVEGFVGNGTNSTIEVASGTNTWTLGKLVSSTDVRNDGINDGLVNINGATKPVYFIDFNNIKGGSGEDTFNIHSGELTGSIFAGAGNDKFNVSAGIVRGAINGEDGDDILNIAIAETTAGKTNFVGGNGSANVINLTGGGVGYLAAHLASVDTSLSYEFNGKTSAVTYSGIATINDDVIADSLALTGTLNSVDVFSLTTNAYSLNKLTTINYKNKDNLKITGEANDRVEIDGAVNVPKILTIQNASVIEGENGVINAESLRLDGTAAVGSLDKRVKTNIANLYLSSTLGETYLQEENSLNLTSFNTDSLFDLTLAGNLTRSATVASTGIFNINSGAGDIKLDKTDGFDANRLTGGLSLNSSGNIGLTNSGATTLNSVRAQNLTITSTDAINAKGDINVIGVATFDTTGNLTATSPANNFNSLVILNAANVDLVNKGKLSVQGINTSGNISTQSQGISVTGKITGANVDIKAGPEKAIIGSEIQANNLSINAGNIDINSSLTASAIDLNGQSGLIKLDGVLSTAGKQTINVSAGQIIQTAKITSGGNTTLTVSDDLNQKADIESSADILVKAGGNFNLDADKSSKGNKIEYLVDGIASFLGNIAANTGIHIGGKKEVTQSALLSSVDGDIKINADKLTMTNDAITTATKGSIDINTTNDISVSALNAEAGTVSFVTTAGKVNDANAEKVNIVAKKFQVDSELGIGTLTDAIETSVSRLSLSNNSVNKIGVINVQNNIAVTVDRLRSNGDIIFTNLLGNVVLDNTSPDPYDKSALDARLVGGPANANYNAGTLTINVVSGDLSAIDSVNFQKPDITALSANLFVNSGSIGSKGRPLVIYVKDLLKISTLKLFQPIWGFNDGPDHVIAPQAISTRLSSDAGQLIQVETIDEVNPAIFTGVRNYVYDDIAILLPLDQRYGDKEE